MLVLTSCNEQSFKEDHPKAKRSTTPSLHVYAVQIAKELGLNLQSVATIATEGLSQFRLTYTCQKSVVTDAARSIGVYAVKRFIDLMEESSDALPSDAIRLQISFVDKHARAVSQPYVAELVFTDGSFCYYKVDTATKKKRLVLRESFTDALRQSANNTKSRTLYR